MCFEWIAFLKDGKVIRQNVNGKEYLFKEVENQIDNLYSFQLLNKDGKSCMVNLGTGTINCSGFFTRLTNPNNEKPKLVFYLKRSVSFTDVGQIDKTTYIIGLKISDHEKRIEIFMGNGEKSINSVSLYTQKDGEKIMTRQEITNQF